MRSQLRQECVVGSPLENAQQLETLRDVGCDWVQGYLFARPSSALDIEGILAREPYVRSG